MAEVIWLVALIVVVFLVANIWLLWYWALVVAVVLVLGGFLIVTGDMFE